MNCIQQKYSLPEYLIEQYEIIDVEVFETVYEVEEKCRQLNTGNNPWSLAYKNYAKNYFTGKRD